MWLCLSDGRIKLPFDKTTKVTGHLRLSERDFAAFEFVTPILLNIRVFWYVIPFVLVIRCLCLEGCSTFVFKITVLGRLHPEHAETTILRDYSNNHQSARPSSAECYILMHVTVCVTAGPLLFSKVMKAGDLIRYISVHQVSIKLTFRMCPNSSLK